MDVKLAHDPVEILLGKVNIDTQIFQVKHKSLNSALQINMYLFNNHTQKLLANKHNQLKALFFQCKDVFLFLSKVS